MRLSFTAVLVLGTAIALRKPLLALVGSKTSEDVALESNFQHLIPCNQGEIDLRLANITTIPTLTWLQGSQEETTLYLKDRMKQIIELNPWVAGRLVEYCGKEHLAFNDNAPDFDVSQALKETFYETEPKIPFTSETPVEELNNFWPTKPGYILNSVPTVEPMLRVVILGSQSRSDEFAVLFSMSHISVDGYGFYSLYKMLMDPKTPVTKLNPQREVDLGAARDRLLGKSNRAIQSNLGTAWHFLLYKYFQPPRVWKSQQYLVNQTEIQAIKASLDPNTDGVPYISTNDILSSWIFTKSDSAFARMAINLRGKDDTVPMDLSGNYQDTIFLQVPDETATPVHIRKVVNQMNRPASVYPSNMDALLKGKHFLYSNWVSLSGTDTLEPPNCTELRHTPLVSGFDIYPTGGLSVVHRHRRGEVAVFTIYSGDKAPELPSFALPAKL